MKKVIFTDSAPAAVGPYSQAIQLGDFLFCSGQIAINPATNEVLKGDVKAQAEQVMKNIKAVLNAGGLDFSHIVKTTIFLTDMNDFAAVNEVYGRHFVGEPPARSTVAVSGLPKGVNVEIEVLAHRG
ncbi:MAG: RidA family protein [Bdellovibrionaceae bacterium]|nr:RidA family protein [Pseudobdellovibrionaceae bacterium]MBX3034789.1 RidA family protein [Pseudobdellovibrionaceae bacterium]